MIFSLFRGIGFIFLLVGLSTIGFDLGLMERDGAFTFRSLGEWWAAFDVASLNTFQAGVERHVSPALWSVIQPLLNLPAWATLLPVGLGLLWLFWDPRRRARIAAANAAAG
ncbi:MAG TPA: hypothetical protein PLA85_12075 [Micropepsaceae bacterium]|nr:hypothetical protein [Micropepsaceae bacterium]HRK72319.1 hypothetical protein [Micropepsaceae bacterium]